MIPVKQEIRKRGKRRIKDNPEKYKDISPWLTVREAAAYLKISEGCLRNYMNAGLIRCEKQPARGSVRFHITYLDQWITNRIM